MPAHRSPLRSRRPLRTPIALASAVAIATFLGGCGGDRVAGADQRVPANVGLESGSVPSLRVATDVAPLPVFRVTDEDGEPVIGAVVRFSASHGGSIVGDSVHSSASGFASPTRWTLGNQAVAQTLTARVGTLVPATVTVRATADVPATITRHAGLAGQAVAGATVGTPPAVRVVDRFANPVPLALVTFAVTAGGGSIPLDTVRTDSSGIAAVAAWTLGTTAGENTLTATVGALAPVTFTATGTSGTPASVSVVAGGGLSATVGTALSASPTVRVLDANGNPVAGVTIGFTPATGSGTVAATSAATDADGRASAGAWTLGTTMGVHALNVMVPGLAPLMITATATAGAPASIAAHAGDSLSAVAGTATATAPAVRVADAHGNVVEGVTVTFAITAGNGSVATPSALTSGEGVASSGSWTLGSTAGANALMATVPGLAPVTFTATGTAGAAATITIVAGDSQTVAAGTAVAVAPSVRVRDANGNVVAGANVAFVVEAGGGSITGGNATTDQDGITAIGSWTLGRAAGTNTLLATVGSAPSVRFTATATAGAPAGIMLHAGNGGVTTAGTAVDVAPAVRVLDAFANPVPNVAVTFAVATGGGSITGANATTNADGVAAVGSWTLGSMAGSNTLTATVSGVAPVTFTATGTPGSAASLAPVTGSGGSAMVASTRELVARATDIHGNPVQGVTITWLAGAGSGVVNPGTSVTGADGLASAAWTLGTTAGTQSASASASGLSGSPAPFSVTATPASATRLAIVQQPPDSARSGIAFPRQPVVELRDGFDNVVAQAGVSIAASIATGGGTLAGTTTAVTTAEGRATFTDLSIVGTSGDRTITFAASGLAGRTSGTIALGAGTASAASSTLAADEATLIANGASFTTVRLQLRDAEGNALTSGAGYTVVFSTTSGTISSVSNVGDGTFTARLTAPATAGVATVSATMNGATVAQQGTVAFVAGPVQSFRVEQFGGGDIGFAGVNEAFQVRVTALDAQGNTATTFGGAVNFSTTPSATITQGATSPSFSSGVLAAHSIVIGAAGSYTLTATRSGGPESGTSAAFVIDAAPTIVSTVPALGATVVSRTAPITLTFSEPVNASAANFSVQCPSGTPRAFTLSASPATSFTLTPTAALPGSTTCVVRTVSASGGITDVDAYDPPDGIADGVWAQFTTAPAIVAVDDDWSSTPSRYVTGNVMFESFTAATPFGPADNDTLTPSTIVGWLGWIGGGVSSAGATEQGGSIMAIAGDGPQRGRIRYSPPAGFEGIDRFHYVVYDGETADTAMVTLRVAGMIWFVDNAAQACTTRAMGCGTLELPYSTLAALSAENDGIGNNPADGDDIFVYESATAYTARLGLRAGQRLIGQDATQSLSEITGIVPSSGSRALPVMNAGNATRVRLTAADRVVALGTDNTLRGLTIVPTSEMLGPGIGGANFGTLTVAADVTVDGLNAPAIILSNGTISGSFASVRSSGGVLGAIGLTNVGTVGTTTFGVATDTLRSTSGALVQVNGGTGSFVFPGVITNTAGTMAIGLVIQNVTGGSITFSGPINPGTSAGGSGIRIQNNRGGTFMFSGPSIRTRSSVGIDLQNNAGATIAFTGGGLDIFGTSGSVPFNAIGGGTLLVLDPTNRNEISSLGATALNVNSMTIDAAGLNFTKISAVEASNPFMPTSGILVAMPQGTGGLTVRGSGTPGSGGNISSVSGYGINVYGASAPFPLNVAWMNISNTGFGGIVTSGTVNARIRRSTFSGNASGIFVDDGTGSGSTVVIDTVTVTGPRSSAIVARPSSGGPLTFTLRGSTLDGANIASDDLVRIEASTTIHATIVGNTMRNGTRSQFNLVRIPAGHLLFQDNTVTGSLTADAVAITTPGALASSATYEIAANRITSSQRAISVTSNSPAGSLLSGKIRENIIGTAGVAGSCRLGIFTSSSGSGTHTALVTNNSIYSCGDFGAQVHAWQQAGAVMNATVRNNLVSGARIGLSIEHVTSTSASAVCADMSGNTLAPTQMNFYLSLGAGTVRLPLYSGSTVGGSPTTDAELQNYLRSRNVPNGLTSSATTAAGIVLQGGPAGITSCPVPTF